MTIFTYHFRHKSEGKKDRKHDRKERRQSRKGEKSKRLTVERELITSEEDNMNESRQQDELSEKGSALTKARAMLSKSKEEEHEEEIERSSNDAISSGQQLQIPQKQIIEQIQALRPPPNTGLTLDFIRQSPHQMVDTKFLQHLAEMHPVSALHELTHRLGWPGPNITLAFDCGPPFAKMYIFKAQVNGQLFQNTVAVNDVKLAKQNVAWLALQEMGFVKPDPANPV